MTTSAPVSLCGAATVFVVQDVLRSVEHYRDMLGFRTEFTYGQPTFYAGIAIFNSWYRASTSVTKLLTAPCDVNDLDGNHLCLESIPTPFLTLICNRLTRDHLIGYFLIAPGHL